MAHIKFNIQYTTRWGEVLCLDYKNQIEDFKTLLLNTEDGTLWSGEVDLPAEGEWVRYSYRIAHTDGTTVCRECGMERCFIYGHRSKVEITDRWELVDHSPVLARTAFTDCVYRRQGCAEPIMELLSSPYLLLMRAVPPAAGWRWGVLGSTDSLGNWDPKQVKYLQRTGIYEWGLSLSSADFAAGALYKYVLVNENVPGELVWEEGEDRRIAPHIMEKNTAMIQTDNTPLVDLKPWRGAGVVIPVFSLRSKESFGIGDFGDLKSFIHWASEAGLSAVQLLPINDTTSSGTWHDSYPYNGISVFALHPIYLDLRPWRKTKAYAAHAERGKELNVSPVVEYESVFHEKMHFLRELYQEQGEQVVKSAAYQSFCYENAGWLKDYAHFCTLRDENHTANFRDWKVQQVEGHPQLEATTEFYCFVQYLLHVQMSAVHEFAREQGVILKGDIPIGICRDSVPAWIHAPLFHFDGQAGAPPDAFAVNGQNWGFPTYNWEEMSKDGYAWWRARLAHMGKYFDAYRIDHVLGFFRIWEVPSDQVYGVLGRFRPALPYSLDEIRSFGFQNSVGRYAQAFVTTARLEDLSARYPSASLRSYFKEVTEGVWELLPELATQRQIQCALPEGEVREALMQVVSEVLFLEDCERPGYYHPRIAAQLTQVFHTLSESDRQAFNRLHDDFFYVRHNEFWAQEAMKKIPAVIDYAGSAHCMLPCAEDLGMVPVSVKGVLEKLNILSLEIQRMPKEYGVRFGNLQHNPYLSVSTIATHDMPPLRLWWTENAEQTQAFWNEVLGYPGEAPKEASPEVCEQVVAMHLDSPSMLCLLALQDLLAIDGNIRSSHPEMEQINVPANPNQYWQYRMHLNIEDLVQATSFNEKLRLLVKRSGRM